MLIKIQAFFTYLFLEVGQLTAREQNSHHVFLEIDIPFIGLGRLVFGAAVGDVLFASLLWDQLAKHLETPGMDK